MEKEKRRYSGQSFEDRQAERREKLLRAALHVAGRAGIEGLSVAAICAEAGLTARYFYESFPSREAIFVEAYRLAQDDLLDRIAEAHAPSKSARDAKSRPAHDAARTALTAFFSGLQANPGLARVFLVDMDDHAGAMRIASFEGAKKLSKAFGLKAEHPLMIAGIIGGIVDIGKRWIESEFAEPIEKVVAIALPFTKLG
jgi:AcrR family transcriptional regulator